MEIAEWYNSKIERHRRDFELSREEKWNIIRISNRAFAKIYDMVEDGTISGGWKVDTYLNCLKEPTDREYLHALYTDAFEQLIDPRKYKLKKFLNQFKPRVRNKRKKIDWMKI